MAEAKAIFVDGQNLFHMGIRLGIAELRFAALFRILTKEIGSSSACFGRPVYVLRPDQVERKGPRLEQEGFEVIGSETDGGADDLEIIRRINELTPDKISEIILVSANFKDFRECLDAKVKMGIRVIVVATKVIGQMEERPMLSTDFDEMRGDIEFVDLEAFKERLLRKPWLNDKKTSTAAPLFESTIEKPGDLVESLPAIKTTTTTPRPFLLTRSVNLSLEVGVSDLNLMLDAICTILKMPSLINSTLEIK